MNLKLKKYKPFLVFSLLFLVLSFSLFASPVSAQGLVPCNGPDCDLCDLLTLGNNIIKWFLGISTVLGVGFIVWGAILIMTAGGSPENLSKGKQTITIAVTGVVIALAGWLIIGTILHALTGSPSALPWTAIQCSL